MNAMAQKKKTPPFSKAPVRVLRKGAELKVAPAPVKSSKAAVKAKAPSKPHAATPAKAKGAASAPEKIAKRPLPAAKLVAPAKLAAAAKVVAKVAPAPVMVRKPLTPAAVIGRPAVAHQSQRAVPAAAHHKIVGQKVSAPLTSKLSHPKAVAQKASAARQLLSVQKKPVNQRHGFKANEFVVYPAHGVGRIVGIEEQEIAGMSLELFVITFDKEKLTLRVPTGKLQSVGMRKLADEPLVKKAMDTLKGRARIKRTMWSRRAQEYVAKINSGDLISIAEVVRDLYRSEAQPEQSYSERQLYEDALDRMARELAAVEKLDERGAVQRITDVLSKSAKNRRLAADNDAVGEAA